jgi:hypothetical protein
MVLSWPDALCERLAAGGRHVIRYDLRDSGDHQSSSSSRRAGGGPKFRLCKPIAARSSPAGTSR